MHVSNGKVAHSRYAVRSQVQCLLAVANRLNCAFRLSGVCVFITAGPIIKLCAGGEGDSEGHVL